MNIVALRVPYMYNGDTPIVYNLYIETWEDYYFYREINEEWIRYITPKKKWLDER